MSDGYPTVRLLRSHRTGLSRESLEHFVDDAVDLGLRLATAEDAVGPVPLSHAAVNDHPAELAEAVKDGLAARPTLRCVSPSPATVAARTEVEDFDDEDGPPTLRFVTRPPPTE